MSCGPRPTATIPPKKKPEPKYIPTPIERDLDIAYEAVVDQLVQNYPRFNEIGCREEAARAKTPEKNAVMSAMATVYVCRAVAEATTKHNLLQVAVEGSSLSLNISAAPGTTFGCHEEETDTKCLEAAAHRATQTLLAQNEGVRAMILIEHLNRIAADVGDYHDLVLAFGREKSADCLSPANPDWRKFPFAE